MTVNITDLAYMANAEADTKHHILHASDVDTVPTSCSSLSDIQDLDQPNKPTE